jgi:hypothetical protein
MVTSARHSLSDERADQPSRLYWLDIDVTFNDIIRPQRTIVPSSLFRQPPWSLQYSVLRGIGAVANALYVSEKGKSLDHFEVDVATFVQSNEWTALPEINRSAKIICNETDAHSPRLEIYVQRKMLRHLVELYVTKRIYTVLMSLKIAIMLWSIADTSAGSELLPLLDKDGHLYFRRTECELLSVRASLGRGRTMDSPGL